jgi:hypothetical protein
MSAPNPRYVKCACSNCSGHLEFDGEHAGVTVACPHCGLATKLIALPEPASWASAVPQVHFPEILTPLALDPPPSPPPSMTLDKKRLYLLLAKLTTANIKRRTNLGDTPLHRAAKSGIIYAIPSHLLAIDLFKEKNKRGETPLHIAARNGHLHQVASVFITAETLTTFDATGETPLHLAAHSGYFRQIPRGALTPALLAIRTMDSTNNTVFHFLAAANRVHEIPRNCITDELWTLKNADGITTQDSLNYALHLNKVAGRREAWRSDPITEKQRQKLKHFGCTWDEGVTKGQASDVIDECVRFQNWKSEAKSLMTVSSSRCGPTFLSRSSRR